MNYWCAKSYIKLMGVFLNLVQEYWNKLPEQSNDGYGRFKYIDNNESYTVRMKIAELLPQVEAAADSLGVSYELQSLPAPAVGGFTIPVNIFRSAIEPEIGHEVLDKKVIIETIIRTKSVAKTVSHREFIHILLPWNWVIDLCAFIIRIPFLILRRAGLPAKVEENIISHAIKIVGTICIVSYLTYKGIELSDIDIPQIINNLFR